MSGYGNGGQFSLPTANSSMTVEQLVDIIVKMQKELNWLLNNMDSANVPRLNTNITQIKSADGETYINGPVLEQYDSEGILRLKQGLNTISSLFEFIMFDILGNPTIDLDSNGEAVFRGNIQTTKSATIGEVLKLVSPTGTFNSGIQWLDPDGVTLLLRQLLVGTTFYLENINGAIEIEAASGGMKLFSPGGDIIISPFTHGVQLYGKLGFFGLAPISQVSVTAPIAITTTQTAGAIYTANEQTMITNLKADITNLRSTVASLRTALRNYGLLA
jgi:hypothetical protein